MDLMLGLYGTAAHTPRRADDGQGYPSDGHLGRRRARYGAVTVIFWTAAGCGNANATRATQRSPMLSNS